MGSVSRDADCTRKRECVTEWSEVSANSSEFFLRRLGRINHRGRRAVALKTTLKEFGGRIGVEAGGVEENGVGVRREVPARGQSHDGDAGKGKLTQSSLGALEKETVAIADANESGDGMLFLESGGAHEDFEFPRAFSHGVTGRPRGRAQDRHAGCGGEGVREGDYDGKTAEPAAQSVRNRSDWHRRKKAVRVPIDGSRPGINFFPLWGAWLEFGAL